MVTCPLEKRAGKLGLPLKHFLLTAAGLLAFSVALFVGRSRLMGFEVDARFALGCAHLLTLGCICATILGVMTQMVPGHGGVPLRWPWAPRAALWLLGGGLAGGVPALAFGFLAERQGFVSAGAGLTLLAGVAHAAQVARLALVVLRAPGA